MSVADGLRSFLEIPGFSRESLLRTQCRTVGFYNDPIRMMRNMRARFGNLARWEFPNESMLFAFGPENNRQIYDRTDLFHSLPLALSGPRGSAQHRLRQSIFKLNERDHHRMRHQLLPPFQRSRMAAYQAAIVDLVRDTMRPWREGQQRNVHHDMHMLVWGIVRQVLYGLEDNAASTALYKKLESWMFRRFSPWVVALPFNVPLTPYWRMLEEAKWLEKQFLAIMRARRAEGALGHDVFSSLLQFHSSSGTPVPDEELVGHAATLFLVAYETTGNTLTWTLFLLSQHPQIQQDLLDELAPWKGEAPPLEDLERLPVLNRILKESMRLLPAVPYNRRRVSRDDAIGPYFLPKATRVFFSIYETHHSPEIYPHPERFLPERWETIKPTPAEYLPFGMGLKTCLGASMAQMVVKIALSLILPAWRMTVTPDARIDRHMGISLGPRNGIPVVLARQDRQLQVSPVRGNIHEMVELGRANGNTGHMRKAA